MHSESGDLSETPGGPFVEPMWRPLSGASLERTGVSGRNGEDNAKLKRHLEPLDQGAGEHSISL